MTDLDARQAAEMTARDDTASESCLDPYRQGEDRMPDRETQLPDRSKECHQAASAAAAPTMPAESSLHAGAMPRLGPRQLTIVNRRGLHARASAKFVQTAEAFDAEITVSREDMTVGGQSIMGLMMLAASLGTSITVSATGPEAVEALDAIERLVADRFGEEC